MKWPAVIRNRPHAPKPFAHPRRSAPILKATRAVPYPILRGRGEPRRVPGNRAESGPMGVPLSRQHIPALDGVRGVAILMVIAAHAGMSILRPPPEAADTLRRLSFHGIYGVDLFFVLSGYLITGILLDTRD